MKYAHYAPEAPLFMIEPNAGKIEKAIYALQKDGQKIAVIGPDELENASANWYFSIGPWYNN